MSDDKHITDARHSLNCLVSLKTGAEEKDCDCELGVMKKRLAQLEEERNNGALLRVYNLISFINQAIGSYLTISVKQKELVFTMKFEDDYNVVLKVGEIRLHSSGEDQRTIRAIIENAQYMHERRIES